MSKDELAGQTGVVYPSYLRLTLRQRCELHHSRASRDCVCNAESKSQQTPAWVSALVLYPRIHLHDALKGDWGSDSRSPAWPFLHRMPLALLIGPGEAFSVALKLAMYASLIEHSAFDFDYVGVCRITASGALYCTP
jgi:hypothetical protein